LEVVEGDDVEEDNVEGNVVDRWSKPDLPPLPPAEAEEVT